MKMSLKPSFPSSLRIVFLTIIFSITGFAVADGLAQPGWQMLSAEPVSPDEAHAFFQQSGGVGAMSAGSGQVDPEITELARGLKYDPDLIYKFVHDHIEYTPIFGDVKGPYMTLMDRSGNSFDQSSLLIALLREAGYNANYVMGVIELTSAQASSWLGVPEDSDVIVTLLASVGIPVDNVSGHYHIDHVWMKVDIGGTNYVFDPSMKSHSYISGVDLQSAMGYIQNDFLNNVLSGATVQTDYVQNLNRSNLASDLSTFSSNLVDYIKNSNSGATLEDIIGGRSIIPASEVPRQTSLPYELSITDEWTDIPSTYKTSLRIELDGIDVTCYSSDIYGRRLTIFYDDSDQPVLALDGEVLATGNSTTPGTNQSVTLSIDHPYAYDDGTYGDRSRTVSIKAGGSYFIVNGWAHTGTKIIEKHRKILQQKMYEGLADNSEPVLGESLALLSLTWLAESSRDGMLVDQMVDTTTTNHHAVGICGRYNSPYIDLPLGGCSITSHNNDEIKRLANAFTTTGQGSAFESGVIEQLQPYSAVSTVKLLDIANGQSDRVFNATSSNYYTSIKPQLINYNSGELFWIELYIDNEFRVILPENGDLVEGDWTGIGFLFISPSVEMIGYTISGNLNGGYTTVEGPLDVPELHASIIVDPVSLPSYSHVKSLEPIDLVTGSYLYEHSDLSIGSGDYSFSLEFKRSYNSSCRLEEGPLGLGWTHNFDVSAEVGSDGFQSMGVDSPIDAAACIVQRYVTIDLLVSGKTLTNLMIVTLAQKWLMDQMIDNIVTIKQPGNTMQFVKLPDGNYNPPPGKVDKLSYDEATSTYSLKSKDGSVLDFDTEGQASKWSDPHGNTVNWHYESGKLLNVKNTLSENPSPSRTLTLNYNADDRIDNVTDSATPSRFVQYGYDVLGNLETFTDAESAETTFEYNHNVDYSVNSEIDGQLIEIHYPVEEGQPDITFVTNVYDSLGRVKEQTNANSEQYNYYYSYYRTEEESPEEISLAMERTEPERFSTIYFFNDHGNMIARRDQLDEETTYEYDGQQRQTLVTYPKGNATEYSYDENHNVIEITQKPVADSTDPDIIESFTYVNHEYESEGSLKWWFSQINTHTNTAGKETAYEYDYELGQGEAGNLMTITYPEVMTPTGRDIPVAEFTYNTYGQVETETKTILGSEKVTTKYEYDPVTGGLLKTIVDYGTGQGDLNIETVMAYDSVGNVETITDPRSNTTTYEYSPSRLLKKGTAPEPFNESCITEYKYYPDGKLKKVKRCKTSLPDPEWQETSYTYTPTGKTKEVIDPKGKGTIAFDSVGDNDGVVNGAEWTDGQVGRALYFDGSHYDDVDIPGSTSLNLSEGATVSAWICIGETGAGVKGIIAVKQELILPPEPPEVSYSYGLVYLTDGKVAFSVETANDDWADYPSDTTLNTDTWYHVAGTYESGELKIYINGDLDNTYSPTGAINPTDGPLHIGMDSWTHEQFDGTIDEVMVFDRALLSTEIQQLYDNGFGGLDGLTGLAEADYPVSYWKFEGGITRYEYDSLDRLWEIADAEGNVTERLYWPDGRLWKVIDAEGQDSIKYEYDENGNIDSATDAGDNETGYQYDDHDRLWETTYPDATKEQLSYDDAGRLDTKTTRAGDTITYVYDELNRVKTKTLPGPSNVEYRYDLIDRLLKVTDASGTIKSVFDKAGRLESVTYPYPGGKTVSYEYDATGNRKQLTYPDGTYVTYDYDNLNRLTDIYDWDATPPAVVHYGYDVLSRRETTGYLNNTYAEYEYDLSDRLLSLSNQTTTGNHDFTYSYDGADNRLTMRANGDLHRYTYDKIYQLTKVYYPGDYMPTAFNYDPAGNRQSVIPGSTYITNQLNQYTSVGGTNYDYDDNGNLTSVGLTVYTYDVENRLKTAVVIGYPDIQYSYDPLGRRISRTVDGEETKYIYDGDQVICEYDVDGTLRKKYLYGAGIDEVVRMSHVWLTADITGNNIVNIEDLRAMAAAWLTENGQTGFDAAADLNYDDKIDNADSDVLAANWLTDGQHCEQHYYYHYDGLGSVIALSDSAGRTVEKYEYRVYGYTKIFAPNGRPRNASFYGNPYMFTGRRYEPEAGGLWPLYYYRARYYSTRIGRFLQTDPIGYYGGMNLYTYCGNNPIGLIDPLGTNWLDASADFFAGAADSLSFGLTGWVRKAIRVDDVVNRRSIAYKVGEYTEIAVEVGVTLGAAAMKTAAKKVGQKAARKAVRGATGHIARRGKILHHVNPLFGHPGGKKALFPTGGLPASIHSGRLNLQLVDDIAHSASHYRLRSLEQGLKTTFHPSMTAARTTRNLVTDFVDTSDLIYSGDSYGMGGTRSK